MDHVLRRPFVDEVEDYKEYKRIRQGIHDAHDHAPKRTRGVGTPVIIGPSDGPADDLEPFCEIDDVVRMAMGSVCDS